MVHLKEKKQKKWILYHHRQAGDILVMTTLVRQIKNLLNNDVLINCNTPVCQEIWNNNPHIDTSILQQEADRFIKIDYKSVIDNPQWQLHHSYGFKIDFERQTGIILPEWDCRPVIELSEFELELAKDFKEKFGGNFCIISTDTKKSCKVKTWPGQYWNEVIESKDDILFVQVGEDSNNKAKLKKHKNLIDMTGQTGIRDLFALIYASKGVISYNSFCMHIAAAFNKKAVIIAGGREPIWYQQYSNQHIFNTSSMVECGNSGAGCLKTTEAQCGNNSTHSHQFLPYCQVIIKPENIIEMLEKMNG
jgi:ADP-heptose:LPS heptosyltransferase